MNVGPRAGVDAWGRSRAAAARAPVVFCGVLPLVWGVGGAARGAASWERTLGSFLMRRGGIVINGAALALLLSSQVW